MNPKNIEATRNAYLSAWGIDPATGSTNAVSGLNFDAAKRSQDAILQLQGIRSMDKFRMDFVKAPTALASGA